MRFFFIYFCSIFYFSFCFADINSYSSDDLFNIGKMNSHDKSFTLYFKTRDKAILAFENNYLITIVGISVVNQRALKKLIELKVDGINYSDNTNNQVEIENVLKVIDNWLKK